MENYREFQGKDLDECINRATEYYGSPRENLEIEILQDAKSGIFGIVGARKAKIRARRVRVLDAMAALMEKGEQENITAPALEAEEIAAIDLEEDNISAPSPQPINETAQEKIGDARDLPSESLEAAEQGGCEEKDAAAWPVRPWQELDHQFMEQKLREIIREMVGGIAGKEVPVRVDLSKGKPRAIIEWKGDAGILIGREGQTLIALQYLASRILSHAMGAALRVQLDIGHYRLRQDDNLRIMAKSLAKKVRVSGKSMSTRPLSSYHRRVIHVCLQPDPDVQTKSIGEGPLKRVLISPKRVCPQL